MPITYKDYAEYKSTLVAALQGQLRALKKTRYIDLRNYSEENFGGKPKQEHLTPFFKEQIEGDENVFDAVEYTLS